VIKLIGDLADRALSLFVPKVEAQAYLAPCGKAYCDANRGCSDWRCCCNTSGTSCYLQRACPRVHGDPSAGCYLSFGSRC
jgi:hypothetical protein